MGGGVRMHDLYETGFRSHHVAGPAKEKRGAVDHMTLQKKLGEALGVRGTPSLGILSGFF